MEQLKLINSSVRDRKSSLEDVEKGMESRVNYNSLQERKKEDSYQNYFTDGITKIDFVLVYEVMKKHISNNQSTVTSVDYDAKEQEIKDKETKKFTKWRKKFLRNLRRAGLVLETEESTGSDKTIYYVKINCPWQVLIKYAEQLNLKAPLQVRDHKTSHWSNTFLTKFGIPNVMNIEVPKPPKLYFTCNFRKSKLKRYLGSGNQDKFFSQTDRSKIAYEILQTAVYGKKSRAEQGIDRLLSENVFTAAFPLHDGPYKLGGKLRDIDQESLNQRQILYGYWAKWRRWYKYQPLDHIRNYFGEKIAMYFAWIGFYTAWLHPVAILGLIVFIIGIIGMNYNIPAIETCMNGSQYVMCPMCKYCSPWRLSDSCWKAKFSYLFDFPGTIIFAIFMSLWAVFFLEFWKRKSAKLAYHWEVSNFRNEEKARPDYNARAPIFNINPVTGVREPYFPSHVRLRRIFTGFAILVIMLGIVIIFVLSVIIYKGIILLVVSAVSGKSFNGQISQLCSFSASIINLILILIMTYVYTAVAEWLTNWEMHRTQSGYENALIFKVFIFQFVNYYSSIFYIAFFKGKFVGYPGHYKTTMGIRNEECGSGGCMVELAQQLFVIMVGKQAINNIHEIVMPKLKKWWHKREVNKKFNQNEGINLNKPWERDYHEQVDFEGLYEEYLEMVLQFGFVTIFVAAFPLAPLFALFNNWIEIRLDAHKLVCETRRTTAERAQNIGIWYEILNALVQIAVITNGFLIAFTSDIIPRLVYQYEEGNGSLHGYVNFSLSYAKFENGSGSCRYHDYRDESGHFTLFYYKLLCIKLAFVVCFEHIIFFVGRLIDWSVPDVPKNLRLRIKRENFLAKQALTDNIELEYEVIASKEEEPI